jgi:hypothetical protein
VRWRLLGGTMFCDIRYEGMFVRSFSLVQCGHGPGDTMILVESFFRKDGEGFVKLNGGNGLASMTPEEARDLSVALCECATASEKVAMEKKAKKQEKKNGK